MMNVKQMYDCELKRHVNIQSYLLRSRILSDCFERNPNHSNAHQCFNSFCLKQTLNDLENACINDIETKLWYV